MTLLLAINAKDGVVLAADGLEAIDTASGAIRAEAAKIQPLGDRAAWSGAGDVTFIQRAQRALAGFVSGKGGRRFSLARDIERVSDAIVDVAAKLLEQANATASPDERETPTDDREDLPTGELLLASFVDGRGRIFQIDSRGFETEVEARFAAIGVAELTAYSLLRPFGDADLASMSLSEAALLAYGMVADAIEISADVGPPVHLWIIDGAGARPLIEGHEPDLEARLSRAWARHRDSCTASFATAADDVELPR